MVGHHTAFLGKKVGIFFLFNETVSNKRLHRRRFPKVKLISSNQKITVAAPRSSQRSKYVLVNLISPGK